MLASYEPARAIHWYRTDSTEFYGIFDQRLRYAERFEVRITITPQNTVWMRVYPEWGGHRINLDRVRDPNGLARTLLRLSYHNFFFWGTTDDSDLFAGFQFTLESGFPEESFKEVIKSIPLIDDSVGEINNFTD